MVSLFGILPLLVAGAVLAIIPLAHYDDRLDRRISAVSRWLFGRYIGSEPKQRDRRLRAAYIGETYRSYAARTYFYAVIAALAGGIVSIYVTGFLLESLGALGDILAQLPRPLGTTFDMLLNDPELAAGEVLALVLSVGLFTSGLFAGVTYLYRWQKPSSDAAVRRRGIEESLPRTVAFVYALTRGGMETPKVLGILEENREMYGETAEELAIAVREMELFGNDMVSALNRMADRTPSDQFKTFSQNLASVLQSGQSLKEFLREQYERYREDAERRQDEILELLATIAEGYVTVLVAGMLFLITILLVFGLTTSNTLGALKLLGYVIIPLANVGFMVYLDQKLQVLGIGYTDVTGNLREELTEWEVPTLTTRTDGGTVNADGFRQLERYDHLERIKQITQDPLRTVLWNPTSIFYVTAPIAVIMLAMRLPNAFLSDGVALRVLDDILIQTALFLLSTFAVVWSVYRRRIRRIEQESPEFLERLASLNEAGMSMVESIKRVRGTDLGVLSDEVDRIWRDVEYGANVQDALRRFGLRLRTAAITRAMTLITNAMDASGNLGPVLRIAATQASSDVKLRRQRRQQMMTYLVVIYISFFVFLVIIVSIQQVLVPSLPNNVPVPDGGAQLSGGASQFARLGNVDKPAYTLVFFHTALVQAFFSGFVAGQLGEGTIKDGTKHAAAMLGIAYLAFILLSSPVASLTFADQPVVDDSVVVEDVSLSEGGYVVIRADDAEGEIMGRSEYLPPGTHREVEVRLDETIGDEAQLFAVPHRDTDGDERFEFVGDRVDRQYPAKITSVGDPAEVYRSGD